jgi:hypothetical protein
MHFWKQDVWDLRLRDVRRGVGAFARINARLRRLGRIAPIERALPHQPLGRGIWLSHAPGCETEVGVRPAEGGGITVDLRTIGRSEWLSLSYAIPLGPLRAGRYLGVVVATRSGAFVSYRPCLRYLLPEGFADRFARDYVVAAEGEDEQLTTIRLDHALLARARGAEIHLFLQGSRFRADLARIETTLAA